jgi:hypothetical protein
MTNIERFKIKVINNLVKNEYHWRNEFFLTELKRVLGLKKMKENNPEIVYAYSLYCPTMFEIDKIFKENGYLIVKL